MFLDEVSEEVPVDLKGEDSVLFVSQFVDKWTREEAIIQRAKKELPESELDVEKRLKEYEKSPKHVLQILNAIDPAIGGGKADAGTGTRAKRPMKTYRNPHTGETVKTRGGNHKTLNEWRDKYGKDAVHSWQEA